MRPASSPPAHLSADARGELQSRSTCMGAVYSTLQVKKNEKKKLASTQVRTEDLALTKRAL